MDTDFEAYGPEVDIVECPFCHSLHDGKEACPYCNWEIEELG